MIDYEDIPEGHSADDLLAVLGPEGFLLLAENYGGVRVYIPNFSTGERSDMIDVLSIQHVRALSRAFGGEYLSVPLAREFRAQTYFRRGYTGRRITRLLGLTESGVSRLASRLRRQGVDIDPPEAAVEVVAAALGTGVAHG